MAVDGATLRENEAVESERVCPFCENVVKAFSFTDFSFSCCNGCRAYVYCNKSDTEEEVAKKWKVTTR